MMVTRLGSKQAVLVMLEINQGQTGAVLSEGEVTELITRLEVETMVRLEVETMVTRLGSMQAVLVMFEINRGQPGAVLREGEVTKSITRLDSKQVVPNVSRFTISFSRQAGHQKKILVVIMFPGVKKFVVVMTVLGVKTRMCMTTLHRKVASATITNKILLFLKGRGHHW